MIDFYTQTLMNMKIKMNQYQYCSMYKKIKFKIVTYQLLSLFSHILLSYRIKKDVGNHQVQYYRRDSKVDQFVNKNAERIFFDYIFDIISTQKLFNHIMIFEK